MSIPTTQHVHKHLHIQLLIWRIKGNVNLFSVGKLATYYIHLQKTNKSVYQNNFLVRFLFNEFLGYLRTLKYN